MESASYGHMNILEWLRGPPPLQPKGKTGGLGPTELSRGCRCHLPKLVTGKCYRGVTDRGDMAKESPAGSSFVFAFGELGTLNLNT